MIMIYIHLDTYSHVSVTIFPFGQDFLCNFSFIFLSFSDLIAYILPHSKHTVDSCIVFKLIIL